MEVVCAKRRQEITEDKKVLAETFHMNAIIVAKSGI